MKNVTFVSTFSQDGFDCYGQQFVDSFMDYGKPLPIILYHESMQDVPWHSRLTWINLDTDTDRQQFIQDHGNDPEKVADERFPNQQSIRFCHKVFALTDAAKRCETEWLIWCDADVLFHDDIVKHLPKILDGYDLAYLGRTDMPYTECGFVAYRVHANPVLSLLDDMRHYYTSGEIFSRPKTDWHDSKCFDIARERSNVPPHRWNNLSAGLPGAHVWPKTALAKFSSHQKGPRRKTQSYGHTVL